MTAARILALVVASAATAEASPLADAIARHSEADVSTLRGQLPGDPATRCTLGAVYAKRNDLSRAMLYLEGCADATLPADIADEIARTVRDTKKKVRESELAELHITTTPEGMSATVDVLPGETLITPVSVWVKAGPTTVRATTTDKVELASTTTTKPYSRSMVMLEVPVKTASAPRTQNVSFEDENAGEQTSGPPPDIKRPSMIRGKLRGEVGPRLGPDLDDPFALRDGPGPRPWFGVRVGGGRFDDGATAASYRPSLAAAARFRLTEAVFLAARLDWSRRGGTAASSIDTIGASVGAGTTLVAQRALAVAVIGQLRGDLRFADERDMVPVRRAGAGAAIALEVAFPSTPLTAGARFEQGLTELVAGARDRAMLVELGVDWR
ncbi:MAG: hypothetical protein SFX73_06270 [Kofleriaceae bacterium]|nr:hypothetical protein [Kofleriaceae bacterium]